MLTYLHVKNIALIDEIEIDFHEGLNILTGETGAGKSIIIGSINAALGSKIPKDFLRTGTEDAIIEILFIINSNNIRNQIQGIGIDMNSENELLISRKIIHNGRSVFRINGQVVNTSTVKKISDLIIDIHSQHEHQSLLNKKNHLRLLDNFLGESVNNHLEILKNKYKEYINIKKELNEELDTEKRKREIDFLKFEINEIEDANLVIDEDKELAKKYKVLSNLQKIKETLSKTYNVIVDDASSSNASKYVSEAIKDIELIRDLDIEINNLASQLEQIDILISDFSRDLNNYVNQLEINEEELNTINNRINIINKMKVKYGDTIEEVLNSLNLKKENYDKLVYYEENMIKIKNELIQYEKEMEKICINISSLREKGSIRLSKEIIKILKELNLQDTIFEVKIGKKTSIDIDGFDDIEFMISTNKGEPTKPLNQVASGGELSRIMLAIKSVLADCDEISTSIFDEIDTGISGRTAQMVAQKLAKLSKKRQLLCITHLPQIAAMSDAHYYLEKNIFDNKTITNMNKLKEDDIPNELARLIGGAQITDTVLNSAIEMKKFAQEIKEKII